MKRRLVLYHGNCIDGWTAAWAAWRRFGDRETEYRAIQHAYVPLDIKDRYVYMLDICLPRDVVEHVARGAGSLQVIDHHVTARDAMAGFPELPRCLIQFDMGRSGAGMAWDALHSKGDRPWLINYVEDRDLWRFSLPQSKEINAWIGAFEHTTFEAWDRLCFQGSEVAAVRGEAVLQYVDRYVSEMSAQARWVDFEGYRVPIVNAPYINISELVGKLSESAPLAIGWSQRADGGYTYSLRSQGVVDVSAIAKKYGGGGHRNSAGFARPKPPQDYGW